MKSAPLTLVRAVPSPGIFEEQPRSEPADIFSGGPSNFRATRWSEAIRFLRHEATAGRLRALVLDLDNVLIRPKGFLASEAQEHQSVKSVPRDAVLKRRDRDERRMAAHGFFEPAAGLRREDIAALHELRDEYGVALLGATARPEALAGRTARMVDLVAVRLDQVLFTGGTGENKTDRVSAALAHLGIDPSQAIAVDDRHDNIASLGRAGIRTIHYDHPDPNHAALTVSDYLERAEATASGERFENLLNAWALAPRSEKDSILDRAQKTLTRRQILRFEDALAGLDQIVVRETASAEGPAETEWSRRAMAALLSPPADTDGFRAASFHASSGGDGTVLSRLLGKGAVGKRSAQRAKRAETGARASPERDPIDRVAQAIVELDGHALDGSLSDRIADKLLLRTNAKARLSEETVSGFLGAHATELRERVSALLDRRAHQDRARLEGAMEADPDLSLEELRRNLLPVHPHLTASYVAGLELKRARDVDRLGAEPNLLFAAHVAVALLRGTSESELSSRFEGLTPEKLASLRRAYAFIPEAGASLDRLPEALKQRLLALESIPFDSEMFREWHTLSRLAPVLDGASMVTVDHALADKFAFYRHLIVNERARGSDIHVIWKPGSADPLVVDLAKRSLGLSSEVAKDGQDLATSTRARTTQVASDPTTRRMFVHLTGVKAWSWLDELAKQHPQVEINGVSHTTSDADELRRDDVSLSHVATSVMADSEAKIRYERFMFARSFERMLEDLPDRFSKRLPDLEDRHVVVHGAAGKIIGAGVVDAMLAMQRSAADGRPPFPRTTLLDPAFASPELAARKTELEAAGFTVVAGTEIPRESRGDRLLSINCTAEDVWSSDRYRSLEADDLVFMNLGTGQQGCDIATVNQLSGERERFGPDGHQGSFRYPLDLGDKKLELYNLADGYPYNLSTRAPNPPFYSDFNNLLITMSLHHSAQNRARGELGARVLDMANVSFTWNEQEDRPIVFLLPPDLPRDFSWPTSYDGAWFRESPSFDPSRPVLFEDLTQSSEVARFLSLLAKKERRFPGTVEEFFAAKRDLASASDPILQHMNAPGPSMRVFVHDIPGELLGPACVFTTSPKSDLAGDIVGLRFTGTVPKHRTEVSFGLMVEETDRGLTVALKPSLEHLGEPRRLKLFGDDGGLLLDLTIPIQNRAEREDSDEERARLLRTPPEFSLTLADHGNGRNRVVKPGSIFKVTLLENGGRWVPDCVAHEGAWRSDHYFELLDSRRFEARSGAKLTGMREMLFRVRPEALEMHSGDAPAALSINSYREGETYQDWANRRGGSGADYWVSFVITPP